MARSVHTDPIDIRAARRLAVPGAARGAGDRRRQYGLVRRAKQRGIPIIPHRSMPVRAGSRLRIIVRPPGNGYRHPAGRADVRRFLQHLPPRYRYKVASIELRPAPPRGRDGALPLGRLLLPGRVILYAQPCSPWVLGGFLADDERARLSRAGALVRVDRRSCLTVVTWPEHSLRDFMLYDVLLHELAHHVLQVRRAGLAASVVRTADHEAVAHGPRHRLAIRLVCAAPERA